MPVHGPKVYPCFLGVRLTEKERLTLDQLSRTSACSYSTVVRLLINQADPRDLVPAAELAHAAGVATDEEET